MSVAALSIVRMGVTLDVNNLTNATWLDASGSA